MTANHPVSIPSYSNSSQALGTTMCLTFETFTYKSEYVVFVPVFILPNVMSSSSVHVAVNDRCHIFMADIIIYMCMFVSHIYTLFLFSQSSIIRRLNWSHILAILSNASVNTWALASFKHTLVSFYLDTYPDVRLLGYVAVFFIFFRNLYYCFTRWLYNFHSHQ